MNTVGRRRRGIYGRNMSLSFSITPSIMTRSPSSVGNSLCTTFNPDPLSSCGCSGSSPWIIARISVERVFIPSVTVIDCIRCTGCASPRSVVSCPSSSGFVAVKKLVVVVSGLVIDVLVPILREGLK